VAGNNKKVVVIAGPTGVGKTAVAIEVAKHFQTEIISADSRQCYKELNSGVARPSVEQLAAVKHHFIASHSIYQKITAATFEQYALKKAGEIFTHIDVVVLVGGTGLYIKAFCEGIDEIPEIPEELRNDIIVNYYEYGLNWLQNEVKQHDPLFSAEGEVKNPQRLMRALEVVKSTGRSILEFRTGVKAKRNFEVVKIGLEIPKEQLHQNINERVDKMVENDLLEEVRSLIPYRHLNALQTVGYKELFDYFDGQTSVDEAIELIKKNTRQYAKRQVTWFKKDMEYRWTDPDVNEVINLIKTS
jgi:tRNA dimethylallyltransferase